jgi:RNA polymerase sigma-70 factor (sigma-E family)
MVGKLRQGDQVQMTGSVEAGTTAADAFEGPMGFEELARWARPAFMRAAFSVTGRQEDAEDAVQSSLVKAMAAWPRVAGQERWRQQAYVRQIVVNTCRSSWRKWGSRVSVGDLPELVQVPATDAVDDRALVRQALARLPARQREVLVLRYYEDLTEAQIAARLGCAPGTVKSSAARALRALRDMLPEYACAAAFRDPPPGEEVAPDGESTGTGSLRSA